MSQGAGRIPSPFGGGGEGLAPTGAAVPTDSIQQEMMDATHDKDFDNQNKDNKNR